ncbi:MAG: PmoA family protein [Phycisphaerae bacterium]|nr:PmoA family protein [Phycisphaerae bacterium]
MRLSALALAMWGFVIWGFALGGVIEVRCKDHHGVVETPVMVDLSKSGEVASGTARLILVEEGTAKRIAAQVIAEPARVLCFVMPPRVSAGGVRRFRITDDRPGPAGFAFDDSDPDRITVKEADRKVFSFVRGGILKPGVPGRYRRACYLDPVCDLDGAVLTDDFPRDHFHHRGLSWAWPRLEYVGKHYDMWTIGPLHQRFKQVLGREAGPVCAVLRIADEWAIKDTVAVDERIEFCVWHAGEAGRVIDVFLTLTALKDPVTFGGQLDQSKGYGGFNVRFAPRRDTVVFGPNGRQPGVVNRVQMAWSDLSGRFVQGSDRISGLAIFDSPSNPGFPNGWCNRSYGYLNPAWPGLDTHELVRGKPLRLRYRVWIHRGDAVTGKAVQAQKVFIDPPEAKIVSGK